MNKEKYYYILQQISEEDYYALAKQRITGHSVEKRWVDASLTGAARIGEAQWLGHLNADETLEVAWENLPKSNSCRVCGCTDNVSCKGGCAWVDDEKTLCSRCQALAEEELE